MDLRSLFGYRLLLTLKPRDFAEEMQEKLRGFTRLVVAAAIAKVRPGVYTDPEAAYGPQISPQAKARILSLGGKVVRDA